MDARECVAGLVSRQPGAHAFIASFCKVEKATAIGWADGYNFPKGEGLIRLYVALWLSGCEFSEWSEMSVTSRQLAKIIAYDIMTPEDVQMAVHYANVGGVLDFILRGRAAMRDRLIRIEELIVHYGPQIESFELSFFKANEHKEDSDIEEWESPKPVKPQEGSQNESLAHMIMALDALIGTLTESQNSQAAAMLPELVSPGAIERVSSWLVEHM